MDYSEDFKTLSLKKINLKKEDGSIGAVLTASAITMMGEHGNLVISVDKEKGMQIEMQDPDRNSVCRLQLAPDGWLYHVVKGKGRVPLYLLRMDLNSTPMPAEEEEETSDDNPTDL